MSPVLRSTFAIWLPVNSNSPIETQATCQDLPIGHTQSAKISPQTTSSLPGSIYAHKPQAAAADCLLEELFTEVRRESGHFLGREVLGREQQHTVLEELCHLPRNGPINDRK